MIKGTLEGVSFFVWLPILPGDLVSRAVKNGGVRNDDRFTASLSSERKMDM